MKLQVERIVVTGTRQELVDALTEALAVFEESPADEHEMIFDEAHIAFYVDEP